jgi:hypothetical protein
VSDYVEKEVEVSGSDQTYRLAMVTFRTMKALEIIKKALKEKSLYSKTNELFDLSNIMNMD